MSADAVLTLATDAGTLTLMIAGPLLGAALVAGVVVSLFQAVTQVQEATLTFIPKLLVTFAVVAVLGHWMLTKLLAYTVGLLSNLNVYGQ